MACFSSSLKGSHSAMSAELRNDHMREQPRPRQTALNRLRWCRCFDNAITAGAGKLRPYVADHLEVLRDVLQLFGNIFTELPQLATATGTAVVTRNMRDDLTREVFWQRLASRRVLRLLNRRDADCASAWVVSRSSSSSSNCSRRMTIFSLFVPKIICRNLSTMSLRCSMCSLRERSSSACLRQLVST